MIINLLKLSKIFLKESSSRWKEEGYEREDPFFNQQEYDKCLTNFDKDKEVPKNFINNPDNLLKNIYNNIWNKDIFITFTDEPILSTNYSSYFGKSRKYNTPAGFYAYNIREFITQSSTFAKKSKYVIITKCNGNLLKSKNYSQSDLDNDLNKLRKIYPHINFDNIYLDVKVSNPAGTLFSYVHYLTQSPSEFTILFKKLGYDGFFDEGHEIIHENEPVQAVFFTPKTSLEVLGIYNNFIDGKYLTEHVNEVYEEKKYEYLKNEMLKSEEEAFKAIKENLELLQGREGAIKELIELIQNPSQEFQNAIIKLNPNFIKYIKNPSLENKKTAININPFVIKDFNDNEELQLLALSRGYELGFYQIMIHIKNPTDNVKLKSIELYPQSIEFIQSPSKELQQLVINLNPALISSDKISDDLRKTVLLKHPGLISWIDNPSEELQLFVINNKPDIYFNIKKPCQAAVDLALSLTTDEKTKFRIKMHKKNADDYVERTYRSYDDD